MRELITGKKILVTGGTGSVGSEIVHQVLRYDPDTVRVFSRDETKQFELLQKLGDRADVRYLVGDIRDADRLKRAMEDIDLVFHAAAMKHVPACEYNPFEAVKTNVLGVQNLIEAALDQRVERLIAISTDKVANPANTMGATKLLSERLVAAANHYKGSRSTIFTCVRFGNVIGSRGSVIPLFAQQISAGGPITVTDRRMTRFMMSLQDAVSLVLKAAYMGRGGEVFILKMPVVKVIDLAHAAAEVFAPENEQKPEQIPITFSGLRPGEKLHEHLMTEDEASRAVETDDMFIIQPSLPGQFNAYPKAKPALVSSYCSEDVDAVGRTELVDMLKAEMVEEVFAYEAHDTGRYSSARGL